MFTMGATHMCNMHNSIFRGYNSIYQQALHIQEDEKADFIGYALTWYKFVKTHAADEENNLFPKVEQLLRDDTTWGDTHKEHGNQIVYFNI
jgi:hemerythrin-like domain-containing protein